MSGGSARSVSPKNPGRRHADDGERVPLDEERGADNRRIAAVAALPDVIAEDDRRRCRRRVIGLGEHAPRTR